MSFLMTILFMLLKLCFSISIFLLTLRLLLQLCQAKAANPVCQIISKITNPAVLPLRAVLPKIPLIDISTLTLLIIIEVIKYWLIILLEHDELLTPIQLLILVPCDILMQIVPLYILLIIFQAVINWVAPSIQNPFIEIMDVLTKPILKLASKLMSNQSGFDFAPMVAIIFLAIIQILIIKNIPSHYFF